MVTRLCHHRPLIVCEITLLACTWSCNQQSCCRNPSVPLYSQQLPRTLQPSNMHNYGMHYHRLTLLWSCFSSNCTTTTSASQEHPPLNCLHYLYQLVTTAYCSSNQLGHAKTGHDPCARAQLRTCNGDFHPHPLIHHEH